MQICRRAVRRVLPILCWELGAQGVPSGVLNLASHGTLGLLPPTLPRPASLPPAPTRAVPVCEQRGGGAAQGGGLWDRHLLPAGAVRHGAGRCACMDACVHACSERHGTELPSGVAGLCCLPKEASLTGHAHQPTAQAFGHNLARAYSWLLERLLGLHALAQGPGPQGSGPQGSGGKFTP